MKKQDIIEWYRENKIGIIVLSITIMVVLSLLLVVTAIHSVEKNKPATSEQILDVDDIKIYLVTHRGRWFYVTTKNDSIAITNPR